MIPETKDPGISNLKGSAMHDISLDVSYFRAAGG